MESADEISGGAELIRMAPVVLQMNCVIWGGLQFAPVDAPIEISCRSLGHGIEVEKNKLGEGTQEGGCHSHELTHRSKHRVARSGNEMEESILPYV